MLSNYPDEVSLDALPLKAINAIVANGRGSKGVLLQAVTQKAS